MAVNDRRLKATASQETHETTSPTLAPEGRFPALDKITRADTWSRLADKPQAGQSCRRSARVFGARAPHTHVCDVPRGSTFTSTRPALAALYESIWIKAFHPAS